MDERIIISSKREALDQEFKDLMSSSESWLNQDAQSRDSYYKTRSGKPLEKDVFEVVTRNAVGTSFEGTIQLISKNYFPDIVANKYYGVEVKSTKEDKWTSMGSSILESTREECVERIYMMFGKLGGVPAKFRCRPYEEVLSGVAVTHYPRYQIDMRLRVGETIFDKMKVPYDTMRKMEQPASVVIDYYKKQLKPGESALWWMGGDDIEESSSPVSIQLLSSLSEETQDDLVAHGYAFFPEIFQTGGRTKYNRFALWLILERGIVDTSLRDKFTAGGRGIFLISGKQISIPQVLVRLRKYRDAIIDIINKTSESKLLYHWQIFHVEKIQENRISQWITIAVNLLVNSGEARDVVENVLNDIMFNDRPLHNQIFNTKKYKVAEEES